MGHVVIVNGVIIVLVVVVFRTVVQLPKLKGQLV